MTNDTAKETSRILALAAALRLTADKADDVDVGAISRTLDITPADVRGALKRLATKTPAQLARKNRQGGKKTLFFSDKVALTPDRARRTSPPEELEKEMSLEALSNAVLSTREMDRLVEVLTGAPAKRTADRLSSLNRFKKTMARILPNAGATLADDILATRPFKEAEAKTKAALDAANAAEAEGIVDGEGDHATAAEASEATVAAPEAETAAPEAPSESVADLPVFEAPAETTQKGKLKRRGTGTPKSRIDRPDGSKFGRVSEFADKKLYPVAGAKPRRPGTHGERSLSIIIANPGISYADFLAKGGRRVDLAWDVNHGKAYVE